MRLSLPLFPFDLQTTSTSLFTMLLHTDAQDAFPINLLVKPACDVQDEFGVPDLFLIYILNLELSELPFPSLSNYILNLGSS